MDKKTKKRITVLRERLQKLQKMVAGAKQQSDEADELKELKQQIEKAQVELSMPIDSK